MEALIMTLAGTGVVALILNIWLSTKSGKNGLKIYKEKRGNRLRLIPRFFLVLNEIGFCQYRFFFQKIISSAICPTSRRRYAAIEFRSVVSIPSDSRLGR